MLFSTDLHQLAYVSHKAAVFAQEHDLATLENGRYDLGGGDYVNIMEYDTKPRADACYESHVAYADIQVVARGSEYIEVAPVEQLEVTSPFSEQDDYMLYSGAHNGERFLLEPGRFCFVGPNDAHMPSVSVTGAPTRSKKVVFKILMDHLESTTVR